MARQKNTNGGAIEALRKCALAHPDVEEGIACKGTALESSTFKARKKAFLFVQPKDGGMKLRLKLDTLAPEAKKLAAKEPDRYGVGAKGWVAATFGPDEAPPKGLLERWIAESYRIVVGGKSD